MNQPRDAQFVYEHWAQVNLAFGGTSINPRIVIEI
jgi:hypothetical protein